MIGIAICTHSNFARGLKDAVEMIAQVQENLIDLGFHGDEQLLEYGERIREATASFDECIYVTDIVNATPYNASLIAISGTNNVILTGASLPMVLELVIRRNGYESSVENLAKEIVESSRDYVEYKHSRDVFGK